MQETALDVFVDCEMYHLRPAEEQSPWPHRVAELGPFQLLDVSATYNPSKREVALAVVNRDRERSHTTTIQLADAVAVSGLVAYEVNGTHPDVVNSFQNPHEVDVKEHRLDLSESSFAGNNFEYTFLPHSFALLRLRLA